MQPEAQAALRRIWLQQEAHRSLQRTQHQPNDVDVWRKLGAIYWELQELEQALAAFNRALQLQPEDLALLLDCATLCLTLNRFEPALANIERALHIQPHDGDGLLLRADALRLLERHDEALTAYEHILALPNVSLQQRLHACNQQALLLVQQRAYERALVAVDNALALAPKDPKLTFLRSSLLIRGRRWQEALASLEQIENLPEADREIMANRALVLAALRRFDEAEQILDQLYEKYDHRQIDLAFGGDAINLVAPLDSLPRRYTARGLFLNIFFNALAECDWTNYEATLAQIDQLLVDISQYGRVVGAELHRLLHLPLAPDVLLTLARKRAEVLERHLTPLRQNIAFVWPTQKADGRLRVGYVSGDFRNHATAYLARKLFHVHDRQYFEIIGYTLHAGDESDYWRDIRNACDRMVDLSALSNADAARRIAADGVHILVDLHGYTRYGRQEIFALRPAPVQVGFLGYPGTLGGAYTPYIIADERVLSAELRPCFSEQPVYLPDCYQITDNEQPIAQTGVTRTNEGLPEKAFVYASFNTGYKIEPTVFDSWMRILHQVSGSVLWLLADSFQMRYHLQSAARERGIDPERLVFAKRLPKPEHLERLRLADLYLDTFIVNAHATGSDVLWAGVPVLTLRGWAFQARVCASLLYAVGLPELVTDSKTDYETLAVDLASDRLRLAALRERLSQERRGCTLFDTERYVQHLERAYELLWQAHQSGNLLQPLWVDAMPSYPESVFDVNYHKG